MRIRSVSYLLAAALLLMLAVSFLPTSAVEAQCGRTATYTVQRGDTLFRIARSFNTTVDAIQQANGIINPNRITAGEILRVPCRNQVVGETDLPPVFLTQPTELEPIVIDCRRLRAASPTQGMDNGMQTFYWRPIEGATGYRVRLYALDGPDRGFQVAEFTTVSREGSLVGDVSTRAIGIGLRFQWDVQALVSDIPVCTSPRVSARRADSFRPY